MAGGEGGITGQVEDASCHLLRCADSAKRMTLTTPLDKLQIERIFEIWGKTILSEKAHIFVLVLGHARAPMQFRYNKSRTKITQNNLFFLLYKRRKRYNSSFNYQHFYQQIRKKKKRKLKFSMNTDINAVKTYQKIKFLKFSVFIFI